MPAHRVTERDLERWVADGIISAEQREAIQSDLDARAPAAEGLTLTTLLYYGGGLLVLVAYGIFLGFRWEEVAPGGRVAIAAASFAFFAIVSQVLLATRPFRIPGELLQIVAVAIVPLLMFAILDATDVWPDDPGYRFYQDPARLDYQRDLIWARMALAGPTVLVAALAFWQSRSPYVLAAMGIPIIALGLDLSLLGRGDYDDYGWTAAQGIVVALLGAAYLAAGVYARRWEERDYSFWLFVLALCALAAGLGSLAMPEHAATGWGVLWVVIALCLLALSLPLQERLLAAAGLLAVFVYLGKLVFEVFQDATAPLAFIVLGLLLVGAGMLYQRLTERLKTRRA